MWEPGRDKIREVKAARLMGEGVAHQGRVETTCFSLEWKSKVVTDDD